MAEIGCIALNAWEVIHGSAAVVIDCYFGKVMAYGLQDSVMGVHHISSVCLGLRPKLEFMNVFRHIGWIHNSDDVCMSCVDTDVVAGELRFTIHCGGHGCGDSPRLHSGQYYGYGGTQMDVQTKNLSLTNTLVWELLITVKIKMTSSFMPPS